MSGDGTTRWLLATATRRVDGRAQTARLDGVVVDVTGRRRAEAAALRSGAWFRALIQHAADAILVVDAGGVIRYASPAAESMFGRTPEQLAGISLPMLVHPDDVAAIDAAVASGSTAESRPVAVIVRGIHRDKQWRSFELVVRPLRGMPGIDGNVVTVRDVTAHRAAEERLAHQAIHDELTGLPNRTQFTAALRKALQGSRRDRPVSVLFIDLDRFKVVNNSLGHEAGDALLIAVTQRLRRCLGEETMLARFGGDEFAALLPGVTQTEAIAAAERLILGLENPIALSEREVCTGASVGVACGSARRVTAGDLLREADVALYQAKQAGRSTATAYRSTMTVEPPVWFELEADLRRAVARGELRLHYQPIVDLASRRVIAAEALLRWVHPTRGLVPPMDFISLAEQTGLIVPIGEWLLGEACRQMAAWRTADGSGALRAMHVNVSSRQLQHSQFARRVEHIVHESGLSPEWLRLEVTERVLVEDVRAESGTLAEIRNLGISLAIDDFGAGASSLGHLRELHADVIKLDRSLVQRLDTDLGDKAVVRAVTALAHAFDMQVVAEGIESPAQLASSLAVGCDMGQGYLFGAPRSAAEMAVFLDDANTGPRATPPARVRRGGSTQELASMLGIASTGQLHPAHAGNGDVAERAGGDTNGSDHAWPVTMKS